MIQVGHWFGTPGCSYPKRVWTRFLREHPSSFLSEGSRSGCQYVWSWMGDGHLLSGCSMQVAYLPCFRLLWHPHTSPPTHRPSISYWPQHKSIHYWQCGGRAWVQSALEWAWQDLRARSTFRSRVGHPAFFPAGKAPRSPHRAFWKLRCNIFFLIPSWRFNSFASVTTRPSP